MTLPRNWYNFNHHILSLYIGGCNIQHIETGAFDSIAFKKLEILELHYMPLDYIHVGMFKGLSFLKFLSLTNLNMKNFSPNVLEPCINLNTILLDTVNTEDFNGLTSSSSLKKVLNIFFNYNNFGDIITNISFGALEQLQWIDLRHNQITSIGQNTFARLTKNFRYLDLSWNYIQTLPPHTFDFLYTYNNIYINLANNPWNCDCHLEELRTKLLQFNQSYLLDSPYIMCSSPDELFEKRVTTLTDLCSKEGMTTTTPNTTINPEFLGRNPRESDQHNIKIKCNTSFVSLEKPLHSFRLYRTPKGKLKGLIASDFPPNFVVIGFENDRHICDASEINQTKCFSNDDDPDPNNVKIESNFKPNQIYRYCMVEKRSSTTPILNCISFHVNSKEVDTEQMVWIFINDRAVVITTYIVATILSFASSLFATIYLTKIFRKIVRKRNKESRLLSRLNSVNLTESQFFARNPYVLILILSTNNLNYLRVNQHIPFRKQE